MTKSQFLKNTEEYLNNLSDHLELEFKDKLDITYSDGVLYVDCNGKTFVINRQTPNLQLWYSSPVSGPQRYNYVEGDWRN